MWPFHLKLNFLPVVQAMIICTIFALPSFHSLRKPTMIAGPVLSVSFVYIYLCKVCVLLFWSLDVMLIAFKNMYKKFLWKMIPVHSVCFAMLRLSQAYLWDNGQVITSLRNKASLGLPCMAWDVSSQFVFTICVAHFAPLSLSLWLSYLWITKLLIFNFSPATFIMHKSTKHQENMERNWIHNIFLSFWCIIIVLLVLANLVEALLQKSHRHLDIRMFTTTIPCLHRTSIKHKPTKVWRYLASLVIID